MAGTFIEGWEDNLASWTLDTGTSSDVFISQAVAFGCSHSLEIDLNSIGDAADALRYQAGLPGAGSQDVTYWLSCAVYVPAGFTASLDDGDVVLLPGFAFNDAGIFSSFWGVLTKDTGSLFAQFTPTATNSAVVTEGVWHFFELSAEVDSTTEDVTSSMFWDGVLVDTGTFSAGFGDGTTVNGLYVGSIGYTGAMSYFVDTLEWDQTGQIGPVVATDEDPCPAVVVSGRFLSSPPWRWVVTTLNSQVLTFLDHLALDRQVIHLLNKPSTQECRLPSDNPEVNILAGVGTGPLEPFVSEGTKLLYCFRREGGDPQWVIRASGIILQLEDDADSADASTAYTHLTSYDPWQYLYNRPVCNFDGTLPGENGISFTATAGNVIALTLIRNTIFNHGMVHLDVPTVFLGSGFWAGTNETTTALTIGFEQGTSVGEALDQLAETDTIDFEIKPIWDPVNRPGYTSELSLWSEMGSTRYASIFAWDRPSHSAVGISRLKDGTQRANKIKFFAGPGGQDGEAVLETDAQAVAKYGEYWAQQFFPRQPFVDPVQDLAAQQLRIRKDGKTTVTFSPAPERAPFLYTEYFLGDRVPVYASRNFREEMGGPATDPLLQRIYGIPIRITDDGTEEVQRMITSVTT